MRRGMEVISLWHCWGGMEAQVSLTVIFSSSAFFGLFFLIFLLTISHKFSMEFRSGEFAGQSSTPTPWSFNQLLVLLAVWAGATSCWKMKSASKKLVSRRKHEELQNVLVNGCSDVGFQKTQWTNTSRWHCTPNHHRLWKLNTGLQATWAMSFSTLPPDSRTLVSKWNTKLALIWKEDFGPLGNSPVLLLLSPGKTPLMTTVAKFIDTSVCGALDALTPASVHSLWSSPKFLNRFCLIQLWWIEIKQIRILHKTNKKTFLVNRWSSGKYVNLLYMYSILGRGSFCFNYCLNSAWRGGDQFVALLWWYGSPGFFDSHLQLICIFWSLFSNFPLDNTP